MERTPSRNQEAVLYGKGWPPVLTYTNFTRCDLKKVACVSNFGEEKSSVEVMSDFQEPIRFLFAAPVHKVMAGFGNERILPSRRKSEYGARLT